MVTFSEPVSSASADVVTLSAGGVPVTVIKTLSNANQTLLLAPVNPLAVNTSYTVNVGAIQDIAGNVQSVPVTTSFSTGTEADLIRPSVTATDPASNAAGVATNAVLRLQFSERVNVLTVNSGTVQVTRTADGVVIPGTLVAAADGLSASWTGALAGATQYRLNWKTHQAILGLAGNVIVQTSITFTTGAGADGTAPVLVSTSPAGGTLGGAVQPIVRVEVNEPMGVGALGSGVTGDGGGSPAAGVPRVR